jgi:hypothetical protein
LLPLNDNKRVLSSSTVFTRKALPWKPAELYSCRYLHNPGEEHEIKTKPICNAKDGAQVTRIADGIEVKDLLTRQSFAVVKLLQVNDRWPVRQEVLTAGIPGAYVGVKFQ